MTSWYCYSVSQLNSAKSSVGQPEDCGDGQTRGGNCQTLSVPLWRYARFKEAQRLLELRLFGDFWSCAKRVRGTDEVWQGGNTFLKIEQMSHDYHIIFKNKSTAPQD